MDPLTALAIELDPAQLMTTLGMDPDPYQSSLLRSSARRILICAARQVGKSTTTAILGLHSALFNNGAEILIVSPSQRQSSELFHKVACFYRDLGNPVPSEVETQTMLALANGSRIISLPGSPKTIRGFSSVHTLIVDEAAMCPDELFASVSPMLAASNGRQILLSSPLGQRGHFYDLWEHATDWERFRILATDCPRIDPAFLAEEQRTLGERVYQQEYCCIFNSALDQVFTTESVNAAFSDDLTPLWASGIAADDF